MTDIYLCPCDFRKKTGLDESELKPVGLADDVLYRTLHICEHPGMKDRCMVKPCRKDCKPPPKRKCAICGGPHNNDLLTDICKDCEARINVEGSP